MNDIGTTNKDYWPIKLFWCIGTLISGSMLVLWFFLGGLSSELLLATGVALLLGLTVGSAFQWGRCHRQQSLIVSSRNAAAAAKCAAIVEAVATQNIVAFTDAHGVITEVNEMFCQLSEYRRDELIGKTHAILKSGHHSGEFYKNLWSTISSGRTWQGVICNRAKSGTWYWVNTVIVPQRLPNGKIEGYLSVRHDITQQVLLIEEARRNQVRLKALIEYSPIGVVEQDEQHNIILANPSFLQIVGYSEAELSGRSLCSLAHPEDLAGEDRDCDLVDAEIDENGQRQKIRRRLVSKGGATIWVRVSSNRLPNGFTITTVENIQLLHEREVAKQKYYEKFEKIFSFSEDLIVINANDGRTLHANKSYLKLMGLPLAEIQLLSSMANRVHPDDRERVEAQWQLLRTGKASQWEARMLSLDGNYRLILWNAVPDIEDNLIYSIGRDISEIRQNEVRMMNASKMISLAQVSAGVAHEINNPLTVIRGRVELIKKQFSRGEADLAKIRNYLDNTDEMVTRITSIVEALRIFSNTSTANSTGSEFLEETWMLPTIEKAVSLFQERLEKRKIRVDIKLRGEDFKFYSRNREILHILNILISNSIEAIQKQDNSWITFELIDESEHAVVVLRDSGSGIRESVRQRIMDPFFSTKVQSAGLGLSIAKGLIAGHGGSLELDETQPHTTFKLMIPHPRAHKTIEVIRIAS
jgi:PAS domain S-box-containing protein